MPGATLEAMRRAIPLAAALVGAAALASSGLADSPIFSTTVFFRITYQPNCTLTASIDGGPSMDSTGASAPTSVTIPPGPYQVSIRTPLPDNTWDTTACPYGIFSMTGPGINYAMQFSNDLGPYSATVNMTFQPASTYTISDANHPGQPITFTTTATGSSSSLLPAPPASTASGSSTQGDVVGSAIVPFRGSLQATVAGPVAATLTTGGKPLTTVVTGRYDIVVKDNSAKAGFYVEKSGRKPQSLTGVRFEGKRTVEVDLTVGKWTFFSESGHDTAFVVTT
jgi:hypothetical protein